VGFSASNRRRFYRHKISLPLELRDQRVNAPLRINATDVSANGCYVESMQPLPLGTVLQVDLWLDSEHIKVTAVVRTCDPGVGNGIEFTGMPADTKQRMQSYLEAIDPQMGVSSASNSN
jgi:c-di-GMP-binding flagellar brake protein YcgR